MLQLPRERYPGQCRLDDWDSPKSRSVKPAESRAGANVFAIPMD